MFGAAASRSGSVFFPFFVGLDGGGMTGVGEIAVGWFEYNFDGVDGVVDLLEEQAQIARPSKAAPPQSPFDVFMMRGIISELAKD